MRHAERSRRREEGFSLIEVIVALGLLASVLISVSGMFVLGSRQVKSGRTHSTALSVAADILEEMDGWSFPQTYRAFELGDGATPAYLDISTRTNPFAARWQPVLDEQLEDAWAEIDIQSISDAVGTPDLNVTTAIRVFVTVHWTEGPRARRVELATVRM